MVRMEAREAELYGERVVELLQRARKTLCEKYDVELEQPIVIEIFPQQKDFAVRTFGMPGVARVLGRVLRPRDHGQQPGLAGRERRRIGRPCCGTSSATWSRCTKRATRCRAG